MNEIIKYKNEMNSVSFNGFNSVDQNIFMALCARMKDQNTEEITFDFTTLRKIINYPKKRTDKQFMSDLKHMNREMLKLTCSFRYGQKEMDFVLFPTFERDFDKRTLRVRVNPDFAFLLNDFTNGGYTQMELKRFIAIEGKYAKTMYKYLRQFRATGIWKVGYQEFRDIMCVPTTYKPYNINQKVIKPAIEELSKYFPELKYEPFYLRKQGNPLGGYTFTFVGDKEIPGQTNITDYLDKPKPKKTKNKFKNFEERTYNYDELEEQLFKI